MRKLLFLVLLLASFVVYAQEEQFVRSYHKMVMLDGKGVPIGNGNPVESKNVFIFNHGKGKDVKVISEDGITGFYIRVSEVNTKEQDGIIYHTFAIDEKGNKVGFYLFKDRLVKCFYDKNNNIVFGFMHF